MRTPLLALAVLLAPAAAAQQSTVFTPYVTPYLPLSAEAQAVAEACAFGPTADPLRMLDNPAVLAGFADGVTVSGELSPRWLGYDDTSSAAVSIAAGVRGTLAGRPASIGVGVAVGTFSVPPFTGVFAPEGPTSDAQGPGRVDFDPGLDRTVALGGGGAVEGPVHVRAGASVRRLTSGALYGTVGDDDRARATVADLGLDVTLPVGRWLQPAGARGARFDVELTAGYALRGLGLADSAPTYDPLSAFGVTPSGAVQRTPSAGIRLLTAVELDAGTPRAYRVVALEVLTGAEDPGAQFWGLSAANVLLGAGDESDQVLTRQAVRLSLAETVTLSLGAMRGGSVVPRESSGVTLSVGGALRGIGRLADNALPARLGERFDLRYTYARYTFGNNSFEPSPAHGVVLQVRP
ncbi:hypothetical protein [Rubrivirga sp. IMCC43871]|uniref:hypothetical protein n=1 Tax=Rubrivirga sp. IMCC43871 TaxID=3391575 RepID=UPI00398FBA7D